jgi:hypothetical protein
VSDSNRKVIIVASIGFVLLFVCGICVFNGIGYVVYGFSSLVEFFDLDPVSGDGGDFQGAETVQPGETEKPLPPPFETETVPPLPVGMGEFTYGDCPLPVDDTRIECGILVVPEDREDPNSRDISLAVAIVRSVSGSSQVPLVYLEGGPGASAVDGVNELWLDTPFVQDRDVILFDQRGAGYSLPSLNCVEYDEVGGQGVVDYEEDMALLEDCRDRLSRRD